MTDNELLARYAGGGSQQCFAELVRRHTDAVYACCLRILGNRHDAEDAVQATFLLLVRKARSMPKDVSLGGWLFWAASHCARTLKRSLARQGRHDREASMERVRNETPPESALVEKAQPHLDLALAALPASERDVAVLRFFYGKTETEIGQEVGCDQRTVSVRLSRALEKLRRSLARQGVALSAGSLAACLGHSLAIKAPAGLAASVQAVCLGQASTTPAVLSLTKGAMKAMIWMKIKLAAAVVGTVLAVGGGGVVAAKLAASAGEPAKVGTPVAAAPAAEKVAMKGLSVSAGGLPKPVPGTPILDISGYSRCYTMAATPRIKRDSGEIEPYSGGPGGKAVKAEFRSTAPPPEKWREAEFDDGGWARVRGCAGTSAALRGLPAALICARSRFEVRDPGSAGELSLSLSFVGGAAVYLNGQEIGRAFLPEGELKPETPAEVYPAEAYLDPDGFLLRRGWGDPTTYPDRLRNRIRTLSGKLPANLLRKGANILAVEVHCALTSEIMFKSKARAYPNWATWTMCSLATVTECEHIAFPCGLTLTAPTGSSAVPNTGRPAGLQVWNHPIVQRAYASDYGDPTEPPRVELRGARNGVLAGQVVVGSNAPLRGLKAVPGDLKAVKGDGLVPASAVQIRYLLPDGPRGCFETLAPAAPAEVAVNKTGGGAVQPVWISLRVPKDAKPGEYAGKLAISVDGAAPVEVPLSLRVHDWVMPESRDFASHVGLVQSPESVALQYKAEMWSEKHWQLMEKSFELLGQVGSDCVFIPLIRGTHFGNEHSMVRWIKQANGSWKHDFSLVEKYLDLAIKHLGKPEVVCLYCWEPFTGANYLGKPGKEGKGMPFTILDPATGKLEEAEGPKWGTPEIREFWKPVLDGCREILKKRGLEKSMMVGTAGDDRPNKNAVDDLKAVAPDAQWVLHSHSHADSLFGVRVGHVCDVWNSPDIPDPAEKRLYGWQNPFVRGTFPRCGSITVGTIGTDSPLTQYLISLEGMQAAGIRGFGRGGADFWNVLGKDARHTILRGWGQLSMTESWTSVLAPGPEGALPTVRFETIRAAAQQIEARIFLEKALVDPAAKAKLGGELADRIQKLLDERTRAILCARNDSWQWFLSSGWQARDDALFAAAAEAGKALGGKEDHR